MIEDSSSITQTLEDEFDLSKYESLKVLRLIENKDLKSISEIIDFEKYKNNKRLITLINKLQKKDKQQ